MKYHIGQIVYVISVPHLERDASDILATISGCNNGSEKEAYPYLIKKLEEKEDFERYWLANQGRLFVGPDNIRPITEKEKLKAAIWKLKGEK